MISHFPTLESPTFYFGGVIRVRFAVATDRDEGDDALFYYLFVVIIIGWRYTVLVGFRVFHMHENDVIRCIEVTIDPNNFIIFLEGKIR